jgi:quinol monooxygenase YgiN
MEQGLLRYEVYQAAGKPVLIIHETYKDTVKLPFHLVKGTAAKYKEQIVLNLEINVGGKLAERTIYSQHF